MAEITTKSFLDLHGLSSYTDEVKKYISKSIDSSLNADAGPLKTLETTVSNLSTAYDTKVSEIDSSISTVKSDVSQLRSDVGESNAIASSLIELIQDLQNNHTTDVSTINASISTLKSAKETLDSSVSTLETWKTEVDTHIGDIDSSVNTLTGRIKSVEDTIKNIAEDETTLAALNNEVFGTGDSPVSLRSLIEGNTDRLDDVDTSIGDVSARVKANADAIAKLNGDDKTVGSVAYAVSAGVTEAVNKVLDGAGESFDTLKEVQEWIDNHGTAVTDITNSITELNNTVGKAADGETPASGLVAKVATLEAALGDGGSVADKIAAAVDPIKTDVDALKTTVGNSTSGLVKEVADLKTKVGDNSVSDQIDAKITALNLDNTYAAKSVEADLTALTTRVATLESVEKCTSIPDASISGLFA